MSVGAWIFGLQYAAFSEAGIRGGGGGSLDALVPPLIRRLIDSTNDIRDKTNSSL